MFRDHCLGLRGLRVQGLGGVRGVWGFRFSGGLEARGSSHHVGTGKYAGTSSLGSRDSISNRNLERMAHFWHVVVLAKDVWSNLGILDTHDMERV